MQDPDLTNNTTRDDDGNVPQNEDVNEESMTIYRPKDFPSAEELDEEDLTSKPATPIHKITTGQHSPYHSAPPPPAPAASSQTAPTKDLPDETHPSPHAQEDTPAKNGQFAGNVRPEPEQGQQDQSKRNRVVFQQPSSPESTPKVVQEGPVNFESQAFAEKEYKQETYKTPEIAFKPKPSAAPSPDDSKQDKPDVAAPPQQEHEEKNVVDLTDAATKLHKLDTRDKLTKIADEEEEKFIQEVEAAHGNN